MQSGRSDAPMLDDLDRETDGEGEGELPVLVGISSAVWTIPSSHLCPTGA